MSLPAARADVASVLTQQLCIEGFLTLSGQGSMCLSFSFISPSTVFV